MFKKVILLVILLFSMMEMHAQSDCEQLIVVCGNTALSLNSRGRGGDDFNSQFNQPPRCGFSENQSLWLKVPIVADGVLDFVISPKNGDDDFDFAIYGPNVRCDSLGFSIRCSSTNPQAAGVSADTGLRSSEREANEGPGADGNGFVRPLDVLAGEEYIIFIDNFSQSNDGFDLVWGDDVPLPEVPQLEVEDLELCDDDKDGLVAFNLNQLSESIIDGRDNVAVSYHRSENDALLDQGPIDPESYTINQVSETLYARLSEEGNGCSSIGDFEVTIKPDPVITEIIGAQSICPAVGAVSYSATSVDVAEFEWIVEGGNLSSGQGTADVVVEWGPPNDDALIKLVGTSTLGCTSDTLFFPVRINVELDPGLPRGATEVCFLDRQNAFYFVPSTPGSQYNWQVENGEIVGANGGNEVIIRWDDDAVTGSISYFEFNPSITDCEGASDVLNVTLLDEIELNVTQRNVLCFGDSDGSIDLVVSGAVGDVAVTWDDGETGVSRSGLTQGDYAYTITDDAGCQIQGMVSITQPEELVLIDVNPVMARCFDNADGGITAEINGGTGPYRYEIIGVSAGNVSDNNLEVLNLGRGGYRLLVTDSNDCQVELNFAVTSPERLVADEVNLQVFQTCPGRSDGGAIVNAIGGTPDYTFLWEPINQQGAEISDLPKGMYTVFITDANGCQANLNVEVEEFLPRVIVPTAFTPNGDGMNDTLAPVSNCPLELYSFQVFNRWGNLIYVSDVPSDSWNGFVNGKPAPDGRYSFKVNYRLLINDQVIEETFRGTTRIIR